MAQGQLMQPSIYLHKAVSSPWLLPVVVILGFFWSSASMPLYDLDEGAFSEATREMLASGNYLATYLDGEPRYDKPIMIYWLQALSVQLFGMQEFSFRLPSLLAATGWLAAIFFFVRERFDQTTAISAAAMMGLAFNVALIAKAATADALLNMLLAMTFLDIYRYFEKPDNKLLYRIFLLMGLGFLTKGPVSIVLPLLVSGLFFFSYGRGRDWFKAAFFIPGWILFLVITVPWYVAVYFEQGSEFFQQFFLHHNVGRLSSTVHGHGGSLGYYFFALPLVLLPFAGLFFQVLSKSRSTWSDPLHRFGFIWLAVVFVIFSFSNTQFPHYILYGCTPIFILMAVNREQLNNRWLAYIPVLLFFVLLLLFPEILAFASSQTPLNFEMGVLLKNTREHMGSGYHMIMAIGLIAVIFFWLLRDVRPWQGLIAAGVLQAVMVGGVFAPVMLNALQAPVKEAAQFAKQNEWQVIRYHINMPSFSVYRQAITPSRLPESGDIVFVREDRFAGMKQARPALHFDILFKRSPVMLVKAREKVLE